MSNIINFDEEKVKLVSSLSFDEQLEGVKYVSTYLSARKDEAIEYVANHTDLLPRLIAIVQRMDSLPGELLCETIVALACFTAGKGEESIEPILQYSALFDRFYAILVTEYDTKWDYKIKCQVIVAIGNIAATNLSSRDKVITSLNGYQHLLAALIRLQTFLPEMLDYISERKKYFFHQTKACMDLSVLPNELQYALDKLIYLRNLVWAIRNFYHFQPRPQYLTQSNDRLIETLFSYFFVVNDKDVLRDICYLLNSIANATTDIDNNLRILGRNKGSFTLFQRMKEILFEQKFVTDSALVMEEEEKHEVFLPILKFFVIFGSGDDVYTDMVVKEDYLVNLYKLVRELRDERLLYEVMLFIGNGMVGSHKSRNIVIKSDFIPLTFEFLFHSPEKIKKEALWVLGAVLSMIQDNHEVLHSAADIQTISFQENLSTEAQHERILGFAMQVIQLLFAKGYSRIGTTCLAKMLSLESSVKVFSSHANCYDHSLRFLS